MSIARLSFLVLVLSLGLLLPPAAVHATSLHADCPQNVNPSHGYHGTITVHAGQPDLCVVPLIGGAVLTASGGTAPQIVGRGRAVFRVIGAGLDSPAGVTIVASASKNKDGPETEPHLNAPAYVTLPRGAVMARYDPASGQWKPVTNGRIYLAATYRIVRKGHLFTVQPLPPAQPATLPATGSSGSPLAIPFALGLIALLPGYRLIKGRRGERTRVSRYRAGRRVGFALIDGGMALAASSAIAYAYFAADGPSGFGSLAAPGPAPHAPGAATPPSRLVIARLGIDTDVTGLGIANGAWRIPSYGAGYLQGTALPGHAGNEAIAGHDDRDGSVFRRLGEARAGDVVQVYAGRRVFRYKVTALRTVSPSQTSVLRSTSGATLTLITCTPYLVDNQRLIVRAELMT